MLAATQRECYFHLLRPSGVCTSHWKPFRQGACSFASLVANGFEASLWGHSFAKRSTPYSSDGSPAVPPSACVYRHRACLPQPLLLPHHLTVVLHHKLSPPEGWARRHPVVVACRMNSLLIRTCSSSSVPTEAITGGRCKIAPRGRSFDRCPRTYIERRSRGRLRRKAPPRRGEGRSGEI